MKNPERALSQKVKKMYEKNLAENLSDQEHIVILTTYEIYALLDHIDVACPVGCHAHLAEAKIRSCIEGEQKGAYEDWQR